MTETEKNDVLIKTVDILTKKSNALEERTKKIEREIKWHWRILDIFLFLNIIVFLHCQILPLIMDYLY